MKLRIQNVLIILSVLTVASTYAQKLSPSEREEFLLELEKLEEVVNEKRISARKRAVEVFTQASSSEKEAFKFFLDCNKLLNFNDKSYADFRTWRERTENRMKNKGSMLALQIQLKHLVLTLRYAEGVELATLMPEVEALLDVVIKNFEELEKSGLNIAQGSVNHSVFAKAYLLDESLNLSNWCYQPGNYRAMYDQLILPYYRQNNLEQLPAAWDKRINIESFNTKNKFKDNEKALTEFKTEKLPKLHWSKNVDLFKHGFEENAALALKQIIIADQDAPSANRRIEELKALIDGEWEDEE